MVTDPIGDMLMRLKNAGAAGKPVVRVPYSALKLSIANVLLKEGYVASVTKKAKKGKAAERWIEIGVAYDKTGDGAAEVVTPRIRGAERVSKPSRRIYVGVTGIKPVKEGGIMVLSTPKGVMTAEEAKKEHVGGEVLCRAW